MLRRSLCYYKVSAILKSLTWNHRIGKQFGEAKCLCCETNTISQLVHETGHIIPVSRGGKNHVENLMPICLLCNRSMQTTNFFVYKASLQGEPLINEHKLNDMQKSIYYYYRYMAKNMTMNIIALTMKYSRIEIGDNYINTIKCKCGYEFIYRTSDNDFALTSENTKQHLVDVICDHMQCLINNKIFINKTIRIPSFIELKSEKKNN
jgi:hypothetical protein